MQRATVGSGRDEPVELRAKGERGDAPARERHADLNQRADQSLGPLRWILLRPSGARVAQRVRRVAGSHERSVCLQRLGTGALGANVDAHQEGTVVAQASPSATSHGPWRTT